MSEPVLFLDDPALTGAALGRTERERVEDVVRTLHKALRTWQLYEGSGPALDRFREMLEQKVAVLWESFDAITLTVEEQRLLWEGEPVYHSTERSDNLAFLLFRDGVRELTLLPGVEEEELATLLGVLARVHRVRSETDDLLTLLWELDLQRVKYRYVDTLAEGISFEAQGEAPEAVASEAVRDDAAAEPLYTSVSTEDFREALYFLDEDELRRLAEELRLEDERDLWSDVLRALFDRIEDGDPERQRHIISILTELLPTLLGAGGVREGTLMLQEFAALTAAGSKLPADCVRDLRAAFHTLASAGAIEELLRSTDVNAGAISGDDLAAFLGWLPADALAPLLRSEALPARPEIRRAVAAAIERLAKGHPQRVVALLDAPEEAQCASAAAWVGRLGISSAAPKLTTLLEHPAPAVRLAAIGALQALRTASGAGALQRALDDAEREVRIAAARALGELRYAPAREELERAIGSKRIREADITERIAFFEAYGSVAGAQGVEVLDRMLNGKSWIGRRDTAEIRASAALALGKIRDAEATRALQRAAADAEPVVRSAVGRALRPGAPS
ncbi:MAG TPA: HEAT repeat domain-containing protein [Longimicrobiaceae bacterium]|nr:HEAT repeat domain-containing protein [Longimicrobiaceae bacterium]